MWLKKVSVLFLKISAERRKNPDCSTENRDKALHGLPNDCIWENEWHKSTNNYSPG